MKLSVLIPYYNRRQLLINTLKSFQSEHPFEVIIVDDSTDNSISDILEIFPKLNIKIHCTGNKLWRGVITAINTGISLVKEGNIMINSAECKHVGSVIDYVFDNFRPEDYMCFATRMGTIDDRPEWWGVRREIGNAIPYCAVLSKENMDLLGGYDTRFMKGIGYDDYDFFHRVKNLKLEIKIIDEPYVYHQYHKPTDYPNTINLDLLSYLNKNEPGRIKAQ